MRPFLAKWRKPQVNSLKRWISLCLPIVVLCTAVWGIPVVSAQETLVSTVALSEELTSQGRIGGVAFGPDGSLYVSNFRASVWRISPDGQVTLLTSTMRGSSGVTVDAQGNVLQGSFLDNRIVRITPDGLVETLVSDGLDGPVGIAADPDGSIYVCNCRGANITKVSPDGQSSVFASGELFNCPNGITRGPDGHLYVVNYSDGNVIRIDAQGSPSVFVTVPGGQNAHIAFAHESLYVTKIASNRVYRVSRDGKLAIPFAGSGELGLDDGPAFEATLAQPNGIAVNPDSTALFINNLDGPWKGDQPTRIVVRRITLP